MYNEALLRQLAAARAATQPELAKRLERAVCLLLADKVHLHDDARATVDSGTDPLTSYAVNGACPCPDAASGHAPNGWCAHRLAVDLLRTHAPLLQLPAAPSAACPEAAFSLCLKGTLSGQDAQLTVRGATYAEFAANVQAVKALLDAPGTASTTRAAAPQGEGPSTPPTCTYHGPMKASSKAPGTWYCTKKLHDGSYCTSKYPSKD